MYPDFIPLYNAGCCTFWTCLVTWNKMENGRQRSWLPCNILEPLRDGSIITKPFTGWNQLFVSVICGPLKPCITRKFLYQHKLYIYIFYQGKSTKMSYGTESSWDQQYYLSWLGGYLLSWLWTQVMRFSNHCTLESLIFVTWNPKRYFRTIIRSFVNGGPPGTSL